MTSKTIGAAVLVALAVATTTFEAASLSAETSQPIPLAEAIPSNVPIIPECPAETAATVHDRHVPKVLLKSDNPIENEIISRQYLTYQTPYTPENIDLLARLLYCEGGTMNWEGQVYTCSAILNYCIAGKVDLNTAAHTLWMFAVAPIVDERTAKDMQFEVIDYVLHGGRVRDVVYFRAGHYHDFGTPVCFVDGHYFSRPVNWDDSVIDEWDY